MANFKLFKPTLLKHEGGFVNHPNDPGGATNKGVTLNVFRTYCKKNGRPEPSVEDLKNISDADWDAISKGGYWDRLGADVITNQSIAEIIVDWMYNSGPGMIKNVQRILGITADGISGKNTLNAINNHDPEILHRAIKEARIEYYNSIIARRPSMKVFEKGWMSRINSFEYEAYKPAIIQNLSHAA